MNTPVTPVSESVFVSALNDLINLLQEREGKRYTRFISVDGISTLRKIYGEIDDTNLPAELVDDLYRVIYSLGTLPRTSMVDDPENLQAIASSLERLRDNPLHKYHDLNLVIIEKENMFVFMAEAVKKYLRPIKDRD